MNLQLNQEDPFEERMENMRIENEILKLKMLAETGGIFGASDDIPPELENLFLHQVQKFEMAWRSSKMVRVYEYIGSPSYEMSNELSDCQIQEALEKLLEVLERHHIVVSGFSEFEPRIVYQLITSGLFEVEISDINLPGMTMHFHYDEFNEESNKNNEY